MDDVSLFRDSIATISDLIDETELQVTKNGLQMIAADRAVVVVIDFLLSKEAFKEYIYEQDARIGINTNQLLAVLRRAGTNEKVKIALEEKKMNIIIEGESVRSFVLPLIDITKEETPPLDKLEFQSVLEINADILYSGIEDAEMVGDSVVFTARKDAFIMKADSDSASAQLEVVSGTDNLKIIDSNEPVRGRYSIDYLKKIMKARKLAPVVVLSMGTDYPAKLRFEIPNKLHISFILAPRVEE